MAKIVEEYAYNGAKERIARLGLTPVLEELRAILTGFSLRVEEKRDANGGAAVRRLIDARFSRVWKNVAAGDIDWTRCHTINGTKVCVGVEIQMSARSDLLVIDVMHLRSALERGEIDVGVLVVPSDRLGVFLTDRGPRMADAKKHVRAARADDLPILLIAIEHDGAGPALAKQAKRARKKR
jgi:Restriction endonuclease BglII